MVSDSYSCGQIAGEELVKNHPEGGKVAVLDFPDVYKRQVLNLTLDCRNNPCSFLLSGTSPNPLAMAWDS